MSAFKLFTSTVLLCFASIALCQDTEKILQEAKKAEAAGDLKKAVEKYRIVTEKKKLEGKTYVSSEVALEYAKTLELSASPIEAKNAYNYVVENGTPAQKNLAMNNLANLLLKQGKADEALQYFGKLNLDFVADRERFVYEYNHGRALEVHGDSQAAFQKYVSSLSKQPGFSQAFQGARRILLASEAPKIDESINLAALSPAREQQNEVREYLYAALSKWGSDPKSEKLLVPLVKSYTISNLTRDAFEKGEKGTLEELDSQYPELSFRISSIKGAYVDHLSPGRVPSFLGRRRVSHEEMIFSEFVKMIAREYENKGVMDQALARYFQAWEVNPDDAETVLQAAFILQNHAQQVDSNGRILERLVDSLFGFKGDAYSRGDLEDIVRLHTILGTIFEAQKRWTDPRPARSALFQWNNALQRENDLRGRNSSIPPSPGIHFHLANCFANTGGRDQASDHYLTAAELFLQQGKTIDAKSSLDSARPFLRPQDQSRVQALESSLQ